ncbi:uncharacterized protein fip1l1a [Halichoeres trimaculatus]|uniref:uncharacterized protein fip1l1a n=1 Tax=Halichoeres trimaculatus TaxID=147232 RepID=UPI003D9F68B3
MSLYDFDVGSSSGEKEEEDEEGQLYQWIFEMNYNDDKEEEEEDEDEEEGVQSPSRSEQKLERMTDDERSADITDYFNYGFDEETWNSYRRKYKKLYTVNKRQNAKTKVQKRRCTREKRQPDCASTSSFYPSSTVAHRRSDVFGGQSWHCREEEQVCHQTFSEEDDITSYILPSLSPPDVSNPPPRVSFRRGPHPLHHRTSDSENSEHLVDPSTSLDPRSSGVTSLIPKKWAHLAGVNNIAKTWGRLSQQEKYEDESRYYNRYKKRSKDRERKNTPPACSRKKKRRRRKTTKPGQKQQALESLNRGENREERKKNSPHRGGSRSRGEAGEVRDSQRSHRPKKKKRKNKNKKTFTADEERKLQSE